MALKKFVIASLLGITVLASCKKEEAGDQDTAQEAAQGMIHFEDRDTGLCYSLIRTGYGGTSTAGLANVPCESIRGHETNMPGAR